MWTSRGIWRNPSPSNRLGRALISQAPSRNRQGARTARRARQVRRSRPGGDRQLTDEFAAVIKSEIPTWAKTIKESGIKPDWHASPEAAKLTRSTILTQRRRSMRAIVRAARALALALTCFAAPSFAAYPGRPVTLIVLWGAGGATDGTARIIGSLLEKELGQPVNVVNRTGGSGVVGHAAIAQAAPDGYTMGLVTVEIGMMHWQGLTELTGTSYTPIGLVNADPAGLQVRADAPYKD